MNFYKILTFLENNKRLKTRRINYSTDFSKKENLEVLLNEVYISYNRLNKCSNKTDRSKTPNNK
jgi:hypothetical protein